MDAGGDKVRLDYDAREHRQKEDEKTVSKPARRQEFWRGLVTAEMKRRAEQIEQLAASAHVNAEPLVSEEYCKNQREKEVEHSQPRKKDVEESQRKIDNRPNPEIIIPMLLFHDSPSSAFTVAAPDGHALAHSPHPTHFSASTSAWHPRTTLIASLGQTFSHAPQATQCETSTSARFLAIFCILEFNNNFIYYQRPIL